MVAFIGFFSPAPVFTIISVASAAVLGFGIGFLLKSAKIAKHKKRILNLEDEMLSNHSRILKLQKEVSDLKKENEGLIPKNNTGKTGANPAT